jgi:hypothetical protein
MSRNEGVSASSSRKSSAALGGERPPPSWQSHFPEISDASVAHTAAFLTALLGHRGQKIFWMSDHDAICADADAHIRLLQLFQNVLSLYASSGGSNGALANISADELANLATERFDRVGGCRLLAIGSK